MESRVQHWLKESDDLVASTERITKAASPDWAVTLHDARQVTAEITLRAFAEMWGAGWLRVPEQGSRPCWNR